MNHKPYRLCKLTVMVNNSTDINKTNHYISFEHKKTMTYDVGYPGHSLGQAYKCGVKPIIGIPLESLCFCLILIL